MSYTLDTPIQSATVYLDSVNCVSRSQAEFKYNLATAITCPTNARMLLSVQAVTLPNVLPNVTMANNTLVFTSNAVQTAIVVPPGNYSAWTFRSYVASRLPVEVGFSYDVESFTFTFLSTLAFSIDVGTTCGGLIGLDKGDDNLYVLPIVAGVPYFTLVMPSPVNFVPTPYIFLKINNLNLTNINSRGAINDTLIRIPVNCQPGELIQYRPTETIRFLINRNSINDIVLRLENTQNNTLNLPRGAELQVTLRVDYINPPSLDVPHDFGTIAHYLKSIAPTAVEETKPEESL